jgi:hypothetical protein
MPEVLRILASAVEARSLVWRTTFSELARWWRWRTSRKWMVLSRPGERLDIQFDEWDCAYPLALELQRGRFSCSLPVTGPRMSLRLDDLAYQRAVEADRTLAPPVVAARSLNLKRAVQAAIDWETATPLAEIPLTSLPNRVKRGLRWWKLKRAGIGS